MVKILKKTDTVFHCAALQECNLQFLDPIKYEINNTLGIINILKASVDNGVRRFVYSASSSAYGSDTKKLPSKEESDKPNPISPYANQKYYGELCCKMFSKFIILKVFL
jgi:UDP-N-acetylglucosamine 4-epimerase